MANNPIYPGYIPKREGEGSLNPMYPGYYTGGPMYRKPRDPELKPSEYKFDEFINQIDNVVKDVAALPMHPKWIVDRVANDWKDQLEMSVIPGIKIDPTDLDDYATDDLAGAVTKLSLNPKEWGIGHEDGFEQTKKQAKKTLTSWIKEATGIDSDNLLNSDFSEIQNRTNEELWNRALGYGEGKVSRGGQAAGEAIAERTTALFGDIVDKDSQLSPLDLKHKETIDDSGQRQVTEDDIYRKAAGAISNFARAKDSARERDQLHTSLLSESVKAVRDEIAGSKELEGATPEQKAAVDFFNQKVDALGTIESVQDTAKKTAEGLQKQAFDIKDKWRVTGSKEDSIRGVVDNSLTLLETKRTDLEKLISKGNIDSLRNSGISTEEIEKFRVEVEKYNSRIREIESTLRDVRDQKVNLRNAIKEINNASPSKNFTSRTTFQDSLGGNLRKDLERSILGRGENDIGSFINADGSNLRAKKIAPILYRMRQDRIHYATKEVLDAFDKGGLSQVAENYVWKAIKNKLPGAWERYTSGSIVGDALKRTNYLGLKMNDRGTPPDEYLDIHPWKKARFERRYANKVDVKLDGDLKGVGGLTVNKLRVTGSDVSKDKFDFLKSKYGSTPGAKPASLALIGDEVLEKKFAFSKSVDDQVLMARLINNDRSEDALDKLAKKMFGPKAELSNLNAEQRAYMENFFTKVDYANNWIYQKTGGKIKALEPHEKWFVDLTQKDFLTSVGMKEEDIKKLLGEKGGLYIGKGNHVDIFKHSQIGLLTQKAADQKEADKLVLKLFKLEAGAGYKGDFLKGEHTDVNVKLLYKYITGKDFKSLSLDEQIQWTKDWAEMKKQINTFSEWVLTQRNIFGDKVDDPTFRLKLFMQFKKQWGAVDADEKDASFLLIKGIFDKNASMTDGYKLTQKRFLGRLERINEKVQRLQKAFNKSFLGKLIKKFKIWQQKAAEVVAKWISKLLAKLLGATAVATGALAALAPIIQAIAEKIVKKGIEYAQKFIKGVFTLKFDDLNKLLEKDLRNIGKLLLASCSCMVLMSLPAMLLIGMIAVNINPVDNTREYPDEQTSQPAKIALKINPIDNIKNYNKEQISLSTTLSTTTNSDSTSNKIASIGLPPTGAPDRKVFGCGTGSGGGVCSGKGDCVNSWGCNGNRDIKSEGLGGFYYNQCNDAWGSEPMANVVSDTTPTICSWGCALTSIAMVYKYFGKNFTPSDLLAGADGMLHVDPNTGWISDFDIDVDDHTMKYYHRTDGQGNRAGADRGDGIAAIKAFFKDYPAGIAIVQTNHRSGECFDQHWVVVSGPCGDDFIVYDPWRGPDAQLLSEYPTENFPNVIGYWVGDGQCHSSGDDDFEYPPELNCMPGADPICGNRPSSPSPLGNRALEIACDLRPGFSCLYNRPLFDTMPSEYSHSRNVRTPASECPGNELWRQDIFDKDPNDTDNNTYDSRFWCTWLPVKTYNSLHGVQFGALGVWCARGGEWNLGANAGCIQLANGKFGFRHHSPHPKPGDVACFDWNHDGHMDHVGVVFDVVKGAYVAVIESNGGWVYNEYSYDPSVRKYEDIEDFYGL